MIDGGSAPVPAGAGPEVPSQVEWAAAATAGRELRTTAADVAGGLEATSAHLPATLLQELIGAARDGVPNEACGILAGDRPAAEGGRPSRFEALRNSADSPYRYLIDPEEQLRVMLAIDDADEVVWGVFHSHVASRAEPSATDVGLAHYPDALYLICSLAGEVPVVRAWSIQDGAVREVPLSVG